jgi:hypothetical protein
VNTFFITFSRRMATPREAEEGEERRLSIE